MSSFVCPLCYITRDFPTFIQFFRHITVFHQNEPSFQITCDLSSSCGVSHRTYSGYKSHVYRHHAAQLHLTKTTLGVVDIPPVNDTQQPETIDDVELYISENETEDEYDDDATSPEPPLAQKNDIVSVSDIQKSYAAFILQLREEFFLPKTTTKAISSYIVTLLNHFHTLLEQNVVVSPLVAATHTTSTTKMDSQHRKMIELNELTAIMHKVCEAIEDITRNEYQFLKSCEKFFDYRAPQEIVVSAPGEKLEYGYFIPIQETLSSILSNQLTLGHLLENASQQRQATYNDDDLMFSFRDGNYGARIDDDSLLVQLYIDDIGLTNPIGAKKDQHKMSMIYFALEDVPDQFRSQLDCIHLLAICESKILKVNNVDAKFG
jgi:hypothetical protein